MSNIKSITDFFVWALFVITALSAMMMMGAGTYEMITDESWGSIRLFAGSTIALLMHYGVRIMPQGGRL